MIVEYAKGTNKPSPTMIMLVMIDWICARSEASKVCGSRDRSRFSNDIIGSSRAEFDMLMPRAKSDSYSNIGEKYLRIVMTLALKRTLTLLQMEDKAVI